MKFKDGKVSVIVPIYKVEKYLDECIKSLVNQTYCNFEAILVDDGSPDNCPEICDRWAELDKRIQVIHQINGGISNARNNGLNVADGEFVTFLDSDDMYAPTFLEEGIRELSKHKADMFYGYYNDISEEIGYDDLLFNGSEKNVIHTMNANEFWNEYRVAQNNELISMIVVWGKIYRRDLFEEVRFMEGFCHEDEIILHQIIRKCDMIVCSNKPYYYYRKVNGSIMQSQFCARNLDFAEGILARLEYFKQKMNIDALIFDWGRGSRCLLKGYNELNRNDAKVEQRLKGLKAEYCSWAAYILQIAESNRIKVQMFLFTHLFNVYRLIQFFYSKKQSQSV